MQMNEQQCDMFLLTFQINRIENQINKFNQIYDDVLNCVCFFSVTTQSDPFPLLTPPGVPTNVTSQYNDVTVHPLTTSNKLYLSFYTDQHAYSLLGKLKVLYSFFNLLFNLSISVGTTQPVGNQQFQQVPVIVTQPPPVLTSPAFLTDIPGVVNCPHCHEVVSTKIKRVPGSGAWCWCIMLTSMG